MLGTILIIDKAEGFVGACASVGSVARIVIDAEPNLFQNGVKLHKDIAHTRQRYRRNALAL